MRGRVTTTRAAHTAVRHGHHDLGVAIGTTCRKKVDGFAKAKKTTLP
jgi:hypothetical protein